MCVCDVTQEQYKSAATSGGWGCRVEVAEGETVVMHSESSIAQYPISLSRPIPHSVDYSLSRAVLRGFAEIDHVEQGAPWNVPSHASLLCV